MCVLKSQTFRTNDEQNSISKIQTIFAKKEIEITKGGLVSNVLTIINKSNENINFTVDIILPNSWFSILDVNEIHHVSVRDTVYVPVMLAPNKQNSGSSEVNINAFIIDINGQQIGDNFFILKSKKKIGWDVNIKDNKLFYFKNDEYAKQFTYSIVNTGNYKQDIFTNHIFPKKDLYLTDTLKHETPLKENSKTISLEAGEESVFTYYANVLRQNKRNFRKVSINNYVPDKNIDFKKFNLLLKTSEPKNFTQSAYKKTNRLAFVKLPNQIELQPFGYPSLPLTVTLNTQNLLAEYPFMSMTMRGIKDLNSESSLVYSAELNYTKAYYDKNIFSNVPWYIGYFDDRTSLELGQISSDIIGVSSFGKGISGSYRLNDSNKFSAFYLASGGIFNDVNNRSFGFSHYLKATESFKLTTKVGRNENFQNGKKINILSINPRFNITKRSSISFLFAFSTLDNQTQKGIFEDLGKLYNVNYVFNPSKNARTNLAARYNNSTFSGGNLERTNFSHKTDFTINDKFTAYISNSYQKTTLFTDFKNYVPNSLQELSFNNLILTKRTKFGSIQQGLYYDYRNFTLQKTHSRGLTFRTSYYNYETSFISSFFIKTGYSKNVLLEPAHDLFNFEFTSLTRYKTWGFTTRYNYGNVSSINFQNASNDIVAPQSFRMSLQNQYTFPHNRLILDTNISYNYRNLTKNNSLTLFPELYYFSKKEWRYSLQLGYSFNSVDYSELFDFATGDTPNTSFGKTVNSNLNIGFSLRKTFGIPIPFLKDFASNASFIAFLDINGNGVKDNDETLLNNVVIKLGNNEVISNANGEALMDKVPNGKYLVNILPLEKLEGWFPNVSDSLLIAKNQIHAIPFVRGVKIYGDVIVDLQKIAVADEKPLDLSRIKITATNSNSKIYNTLTDNKGHFEFYLPNGNYIVNMDEGILDSNLRLSKNNIPVSLKESQDGIYISFYVIEKRRKVIIRDFSEKKN